MVRLSGTLFINDEVGTIEVWFDVDEELEEGLAASGAPWLIAMTPYALEFGGTIEIDRPTDSLLVENSTMLGRVYRSWYPFLKPYDIVADRQIISTGADKAVSFFSGGIDGMHTALRHTSLAGSDQVGNVDELLIVWGFDIKLDLPAEFEALYSASKPFAERLGLPLRTMVTNIRRPGSPWARRWGPLCHTMGRAACVHALEGRYRLAVWGSNFPAEHSPPEGSHPWTDQYHSSTSLKTSVDGNAYSRMTKVAFLSKYPWTLENVHVCYRNSLSSNCGKCIKCVRSGIAIDLVGLSGQCKSLSLPLPADRIERAYCGDSAEFLFFEELIDYSRTIGRRDIEKSLSIAMRRSQRFKPLMDLSKRFDTWPLAWRLRRMIVEAVTG